MKRFLPLSCLALVVACSSNPSGPSPDAASSAPVAQGADGAVSSKQVTIERIRLRRALGPDFVTSLTNGQVIDVPVNTNLDIWAEIRRLETDRARLLVNWGNGNSDFSSCGQCRLENLYKETGRYTVTITLIDLNAPTGSEILTSLTITLNVIDVSEAALSCTAVSTDFSSFSPISARSPFVGTGLTIVGNSFSRVRTELLPFTLTSGRILFPAGPLTINFASDKNFATIAFHHSNFIEGVSPISFKAFDGSGEEVLSGSTTGAIGGPLFSIEDTLTVSGATFRKLEITADVPLYYLTLFFDNVQAGCR